MAEPIPEKLTYLGKIDYRNKAVTFGIKKGDRTRHTYIIGKTGMGKSTLLENMAVQDIQNGEGVCIIDPHGSMAEKMLDFIPESRIKDVIYFAPFDTDSPIGLNVLEKVDKEKRHLVANGIMAAFKKTFVDSDGKGTFSARMEYILNNIILALLENDGQSLLGVNRMLTDKDYRKWIVSNVTDPTVKEFWEKEYANYSERFAQEAAPAIQNKVGQFAGNPLIRNIVGQQRTSIDLRDAMDTKKILIVNLSKGKVGEGNANLIGSLLITKIYLAAMSRADAGPYELESLPPFYLYVDEFQNFANESFASILSEARKYNLALTVAHQYVEQMTDEVKSAVFGNVGTMIVFRVGATDAEMFEKEFAPYFILDDFVNLSAYQVYLRLMIDGQGSRPFSAHTLPAIQKPAISSAQAVIAYSRKAYGRPVAEVEQEINDFYKPVIKEEKRREEPTERQVNVRQIRNDTPLPPRREYKPEPTNQEDSQAKAMMELDRKNIAEDEKRREEERRRQEDRRAQRAPRNNPRREERTEERKPAEVGGTPAMSLKDALARAMEEHKKEKVEGNAEDKDVKVSVETKVATQKISAEVPEDVLRKLIE
ncbi:MAG: hypothetical protein JWN37_369 [Candidatus Nomurabacteria bacterium]|nr:hypothetical protein [Candidatus Nomurabacteria bacterium]